MKKDIFKNAKIGDIYKTRSGKIAVYFHRDEDYKNKHILIVEGRNMPDKYECDGRRAYSLDYQGDLTIIEKMDTSLKPNYIEIFNKKFEEDFAEKPDENDMFYKKYMNSIYLE